METEFYWEEGIGERVSADSRGPRTYAVNPAILRRQNLVLFFFNLVPALATVAALAFSWRHGLEAVNVWLAVGMAAICTIGFEGGFHRYLSHRAFSAGPVVKALILIAGSMTAAGPPLQFATTHRHHHAFSDVEGDPHSPNLDSSRLRGFLYSHLLWIYSPIRVNMAFYGRDLLQDGLLAWINRGYFVWVVLGIAIPTAIGAAATGTWVGTVNAFLWAGWVRIFFCQQSIYAVNSICHTIGTRPFKTRDGSTNNALLVLPTLGASLHNCHHAFPYSATNWLRWWQVDPLGALFRGLELAGLIRDVKRPSRAAIDELSR